MATTSHACVHALTDPILHAIDVHDTAWSAFQTAPEGRPSELADQAMSEALDALLTTPCNTQFGALSLLRHLRWWLQEEREFSASYQPAYGLAQARAADIALFLGVDFPSVTPPRSRVAPVLRALRDRAGPALTLAGEAVAALVLVAGGIVLTGLATLV